MKDKEIIVRTKGFLTAALLIAALLLLQTSAFAADLDYSGAINSFTGAPTTEKGSSVNENWALISSGIYFDVEKRVYVYSLGNASGETVSSNVADGMVVTGEVQVVPSKGVNLRLYCEGNLMEDANLSLIKEPGRYVVEAQTSGSQYVRLMSFTIVGPSTCLVSSYPMPSGFVIKSVEMNVKDENGEWVPAQPQWDRSKVHMQKDGSYKVQYECPKSGMSYTLQTIIDHTPPQLALENVVNGLARGPVDISDLEEGCKIGITLNGGKLSYRAELTLSGDYEIVVQDEAGNRTNYAFTILVYLDSNSWIFFGLVVLVLAGTGFYLYWECKHLRIR